MVVPFTKFTTKKWVVLASKIDRLFIGVGISIVIYLRHKKTDANASVFI